MAHRVRRIHITAVGSSATRDVDRLSPNGFDGMLALARKGVGERYAVTANRQFIYSTHDDRTGGRVDDDARARELTKLFADDGVAAIVTIRGGAWFTRILDQIDFEVLQRRRTPIYLFGFSEMTTLVNIAGSFNQAIGLYDLGPGFLFAANERYAMKHIDVLTRSLDLGAKKHVAFAMGWAMARFPQAFSDFFEDVANILDGRGSSRVPTGRLLQGHIANSSRIQIVGGTLSVTLPLVGSRYASAVDTAGKWLALEDINEDVDPIDRMMAGLQLAGLFEHAAGVILGNFHKGKQELSEKAFHILQHHLPRNRHLPVIALDTFGHIENIAPLPMHREVTLRKLPGRSRQPRIEIEIPWQAWTKAHPTTQAR